MNNPPWLPPGSDKLAKATTIQGMFVRQVQQQANWHDWQTLTAEERVALAKDLVMHAQEELLDVQRLTHRDRYHILSAPAPVDPYTLAEQGADVVKLMIAVMALGGVSPDQFIQAFNRRTDAVDEMWKGENLKLASEVEVVMVDIDGCQADWWAGIRAFAEQRGVTIQAGNDSGPQMEAIKDAFDAEGGYLALEPITGAVETLQALKASGRKIVHVTARPMNRHKRVYGDTVEWFRQNAIPCDHLIFNRDKAEAARSLAPAKIIAHIEDRPKHCLEVAALGIPVLRLPSEYTERVEHPGITPVQDWAQIKKLLLGTEARAA